MSSKDHTKLYFAVFGGLMVLTVATVGVSYIDFPKPWGLVVGLAIATTKAVLVAAFFMHLKWEKALIYSILGITAVCALIMFTLPMIDTSWTTSTRTPQPVVIPHGESHGPTKATHDAHDDHSGDSH
jgi:cytochrome c oxidase subunit 4